MCRVALYLLIFFASYLEAQTTNSQFSQTDTISGEYQIKSGDQFIFITSGFGSDQISQNARLDSISGFYIKEITLVYSRYRKADNFNQAKLNASRWANLQATYPSLFQSSLTNYKNVCQDVSDDVAAKKLSHGFYIYFENRTDTLKRTAEIQAISQLLNELGVDTSSNEESSTFSSDTVPGSAPFSETKTSRAKFKTTLRTTDPMACRQPFYGTGIHDLDNFFRKKITLTSKQKRNPKELFVEVQLRLTFNGIIKNASILSSNKLLVEQVKKALYEMEPWNPAIKNGIIIKSDVKFKLQYSSEGEMALKGGIQVAPFLAKCGTQPDEELFDFSAKSDKPKRVSSLMQVADNAIMKNVILQSPSLDSVLLVVDLTGSMGPYIEQVLDLMADLIVKNKPHVSCVSLFNDGNSKADKNKVIGNTGGIIVLNDNITLDRLGEAILRSMKNGSGGDCMENNIEAVKQGLKSCKTCRDIVMVADNFATPRDASLLKDINRPIHWILCGATDGFNTYYLDLIRENKGYLHTNKSITNTLHLLQENEILVVDGFEYQLKNGKFKPR